jgi:nickel-dependent lactate racemase
MQVNMKYGSIDEVIKMDDKDRVYLATPPQGPPAPAGPAEMVVKALQNPVGTARLSELARGKKTAVILISDHTRPTPSNMVVPLLLSELVAAGLPESSVTVMIATGLHERTNLATAEKMLGADLLKRVRLAVHDPDDASNLVDLGKSSNGTPIKINRIAVEAEVLVSVSVIEPHLFYGWCGGAKNILPGVAARETVYAHHGRFCSVPAGLDFIEGNLHRADAEEAGRMAGLDFICNLVLDEKRQVIGAFAGDCVAAHREGVKLGRALTVTTVPEKADLVLSALGGSPRDADFWQAEGKSMMHTQHLVKDGGILVVISGCEKGIGGQVFSDLLQKAPAEILKMEAEQNYSVPLMKASDMARVSGRVNLWLVCPGIKQENIPLIPVRFFPNIQAATEAAMSRLKRPASVLVVPDASRVVVVEDTACQLRK